MAAWNFWKQTHGKNYYLIRQLFQILLCNLISQHAFFCKMRWMLMSDPLFKFPLVHELIFEIVLHGFWLKILCETITTFLWVVKDWDMIFSKLFYAKTNKNFPYKFFVKNCWHVDYESKVFHEYLRFYPKMSLFEKNLKFHSFSVKQGQNFSAKQKAFVKFLFNLISSWLVW